MAYLYLSRSFQKLPLRRDVSNPLVTPRLAFQYPQLSKTRFSPGSTAKGVGKSLHRLAPSSAGSSLLICSAKSRKRQEAQLRKCYLSSLVQVSYSGAVWASPSNTLFYSNPPLKA